MTDEWIKKMCYTPTMEYYSAFKRMEILSYVTNRACFYEYVLSIIVKLIEERVKWYFQGLWGRRARKSPFNGCKVSATQDE